MAQERLSLRKIREVLRLKHEVALSNRAIARACRVSNSTVGEYVRRAKQAGLGWPLPEELGEEELYRKLFPEGERPKTAGRPQPGWEEVARGLPRKRVRRKRVKSGRRQCLSPPCLPAAMCMQRSSLRRNCSIGWQGTYVPSPFLGAFR